MTTPDRLTALSARVSALTGQQLRPDQLDTVVARAFQHSIDLEDDGQLRALVGGLAAGFTAPASTPPIYQAPTPQPHYPYHPPAGYPQYPAAGYPPPPQGWPAPATPTRRPAGFMAAGILIVLGAMIGAAGVVLIHLRGIALPSASSLALAAAFLLIALSATSGATKAIAAIAAVSAGASLAVIVAAQPLYHMLPFPRLLFALPGIALAVAVLLLGITGRSYFGTFGMVAGIGYAVVDTAGTVFNLIGMSYSVWMILYVIAGLFLVLFGIAVLLGRIPAEEPA